MQNRSIKKLCTNRSYVGITRNILDPNRMWGFILAFSNKFVLLQDVYDFHFDGYSIIRQRDITNIRHNQYDKNFVRILKSEGLLKRIGLKENISLNDWFTVFGSLKDLGRNIIIECEEPKIDKFIIGKIIEFDKKEVNIRHFDPMGKWEKRLRKVPYEHITKVSFENEYIKIFSKYLRPLK